MKKTNFTFLECSLRRGLSAFMLISLIYTFAMSQNRLSAQCSLACNSMSQLSLDDNCEGLVTPDMVLNASRTSCPNGEFEVILQYHGKTIPTSPLVTSRWVGYTLDVTVRDIISGNSCWGKISIEDKLAPIINCFPDTFNCYDLYTWTGPNVRDNCTDSADVKLTILNEVPTPLDCDPEFVKRITRTYQATDSSGNVSIPCDKDILLRRIRMRNVRAPQNWVHGTIMRYPRRGRLFMADTSAIACKDINSGKVALDADGHPHPSYTGAPTVNGFSLYPNTDVYCNVTTFYRDIDLGRTGCVHKYIRLWTIQEWWCSRDIIRVISQTIEISDTIPPTIACPPDMEVTTNGGYDCEGDVWLPVPVLYDSCSGKNVTVDAAYPGGHIKNMTATTLIKLPAGRHRIKFTAYDDCYNADSCFMYVDVNDHTAPVAICDQHTTVGLTYDGTAHIYAQTFDDGSYDDCYLDSMRVRRMDQGGDCGAQGTHFKKYVEFCCADVGTTVMVIFRVWDHSGNWNECMVEVNVQDKLAPTIVCPPHIFVPCDYKYDITDLDASFGKVVDDKYNREPIVLYGPNTDYSGGDLIDGYAHDNCQVTITQRYENNLTQCNVGTIVRTFYASDANGTDSCKQVITFNNPESFNYNERDIIWPLDVERFGCLDPNSLTPDSTGRPRFIEDECDLVGASYKDHVFKFFNGTVACFKIVRVWTVIDWCQFTSHRGGHIEYVKWVHEQIIKVNNIVDPVFESLPANDTLFCSFDTTCRVGHADLIATASDDCTPADELRWEYHVDLNNDGVYDDLYTGLGGTIDASGDYPLGTHKIRYIFEDRCGNKVGADRTFSVVNCKAPTPYCKNGLVIELMPVDTDNDGVPDWAMIETWASDFDQGSFGPCDNPVVLSFSADTTDKTRMYDCDSLGQNDVEIWVTDRITGNQAFCKTFVIIQDNNGACSGNVTGGVISGLIVSPDDSGIEEVEVQMVISGMSTIMTNVSGKFAFPTMNFGGSYEVIPGKNTDPLNGVTTRDLVAIQRHLLGKKEFDTPYKYIAADATNNNNVSTSDIALLRKLILGKIQELPNNLSWRFLDNRYQFPDVKNPFGYPETYNLDPFDHSMDMEFVGVKIGDITGDATTNGLQGTSSTRSLSTLTLTADNIRAVQGETVRVAFRADQFNEINGYQFTIQFNENNLEFVSFEAGSLDVTDNNFGFTGLNDGLIATSWNSNEAMNIEDNNVLFEMVFIARTQLSIANEITINSAQIVAEAYNESDELMDVEISFRGEGNVENVFVLHQNVPNPFETTTVIGFELPQAMQATLTIYDVTGKVINAQVIEAAKGYNEIELDAKALNVSGVLYYQLDTRGYTATKKMVVLK